jgi:hypothetical protein
MPQGAGAIRGAASFITLQQLTQRFSALLQRGIRIPALQMRWILDVTRIRVRDAPPASERDESVQTDTADGVSTFTATRQVTSESGGGGKLTRVSIMRKSL